MKIKEGNMVREIPEPVYTEIFEEIKVTDEGHFQGKRKGMLFSASFSLFLISKARDKGCSFEDLADGFGKGRGTLIAETGESDWSGIRDSSDKAINEMLQRSLNHLFGN